MHGWIAGLAASAVAGTLAGPVPSPSGSGPGFAQARPAVVSTWDCWIDAAEGGGIRCIADRDVPTKLPEGYSDEDEAAEAVLELVHDYLHRGKPTRASELVRDAWHLLRRDDLWTVRLGAPPLDSSWREDRPSRLVQSLLCRGVPACAVRFHH